jgi:ribonucleoside-diphosphate reductase alpha chain
MPAVISDNSRQIIEARYLDEGEKRADDVFRRVSMGNQDYYELMSDLLFLPNSPTLFNLGTKNGGTLSACFVFDIEDCLLGDWPDGGLDSPFPSSILGTTFKAACVAKAGGGVGYYLGNIRPQGTLVRSTHKKACGPVGVLHWLHRLRSLITQGGKRDLAQMGVLPVSHADIRKFIHCKDEDPKALESFNISVSWFDEWIKKVDWDQLDSGTNVIGPGPTDLWREQCKSAWRTGCPGMLFWDTVNATNVTPHLGDINATNPCGETPNLSDEPCNLGSLALRRLLVKIGLGRWRINWDLLKETVRRAIRFMDGILDANIFPHPDITKMARATRKLGLGVMGWADMLAMLRIPYDSQEAVDLADELMKTISVAALNESGNLGQQKGLYPAYDPEKSPKWAPPCRNSTRTSIAPTGTISIIAECEPSIEPHFALERQRTTNEGIKLTENITDWLGDLGGFVPKIANEIPLEWHVKHQAAFQKHTDLGVSKTINLPNSATVQDVSRAYRLMWESKCKGGTVYRDRCRDEQVLVAKKRSVYAIEADVPSDLPNDVPQLPRHKFYAGDTKCYLHVGTSSDGKRPVEIFLTVSKAGSTLRGLMDSWAKQTSNSLQRGMPLDKLVDLHEGERFEPSGMTRNKEIPICTSIPDYVVRYLKMKFDPPKEKFTVQVAVATDTPATNGKAGSGELCPDCGAELIYQAGCLYCVKSGCGFSRCG